METKSPHPRVQEFVAACEAARLDPLTVVSAAGVHRSQWFRWRSGAFTPSLKKWDRVERALADMTSEAA